MSETLRELPLPDWFTIEEAATYLGITRQAAGRVAMRKRFPRCRLGQMVLLSRSHVERYATERLPYGPRQPRPTTTLEPAAPHDG